MNNSDMVGAASRESKAVILMDRINRFEEIISRMCDMRDKIQTGQNNPREAPISTNVEQPIPSVVAVLNDGPEILQTQYNKMSDLIEQLETDLF